MVADGGGCSITVLLILQQLKQLVLQATEAASEMSAANAAAKEVALEAQAAGGFVPCLGSRAGLRGRLDFGIMAAKKTAPKAKTTKPVKGKQKRITALPDPDKGGGVVRSRAHIKFNQASRTRYLTHLGESGLKTQSAEAAGVDYQTVRNYLAIHPDFQDEIEKAVEAHRDVLLAEVVRRGKDGWVEAPIFDKEGVKIGDKHRYSDRLLEVALKRVDPLSRESINKVEHSGSAVVGTVNFDPTALAGLSKAGRDALRIVLKELAAGGKAPEGAES